MFQKFFHRPISPTMMFYIIGVLVLATYIGVLLGIAYLLMHFWNILLPAYSVEFGRALAAVCLINIVACFFQR